MKPVNVAGPCRPIAFSVILILINSASQASSRYHGGSQQQRKQPVLSASSFKDSSPSSHELLLASRSHQNSLLHSSSTPITNSLWSSGLSSDGSSSKQSNNINKQPNSVGVNINAELVLPRFAEPVSNVTVVAGRDATFHCVIDNLQKFKVAWVRVDTHSILTIHNQVITRNYRIQLAQAGGRNWVLKIHNVAESDRGFYMCQINTDPMRYQEAYLEVVVPPDIVDSESSTDTVVREGTNVSLTCAARGHPQPQILWRREDGAPIGRGKTKEANSYDGEVLNIPRVSRLHIGAYLCIASNGIPPSVSKRITLSVQFAPVLWIPNQLEGTVLGQEVRLICQIEAFPVPIVYWTTESGEILIGNSRLIMGTHLENEYKMTMTLHIKNMSREHFGGYRCIVRNSLGETDGLIRIYEVPAVTRLPTDSLEPSDSEMDDSEDSHGHQDSSLDGQMTDKEKPKPTARVTSAVVSVSGGRNLLRDPSSSSGASGRRRLCPSFVAVPAMMLLLLRLP